MSGEAPPALLVEGVLNPDNCVLNPDNRPDYLLYKIPSGMLVDSGKPKSMRQQSPV